MKLKIFLIDYIHFYIDNLLFKYNYHWFQFIKCTVQKLIPDFLYFLWAFLQSVS